MFITCSTTVKTISSSIEVTFCNSTDDDPVQQVFSHLKWLSIMMTLCIDNRKKKEEKKEGKPKATPLPYPQHFVQYPLTVHE